MRKADLQEFGEGLCATCRLPDREDALQVGQTAEVHSGDQISIGDQDFCARILKLVSHLAFAIAGVQRSRDGTRQRGRVIAHAEFPGVANEDSDYIPRLDSDRHKISRDALEHLGVTRVVPAMVLMVGRHRGVHDSSVRAEFSACLEDGAV